MTAVLGYATVCLLALTAVLAAADAAVRSAARRKERMSRLFGPVAETAIAGYLADIEPPPVARGKGERAILLQVAIEALGDLRGSERDRLAGMLGQLGYVREARARLGSRRSAVRRRAAETLAVTGTPDALAALRPALADDDVLVRNTAALLLAETADDETAAAVIAVAEQDVLRAPGAVAATVLALGQCRPAAIGAMLRPGVRPELKAIAIAVAGSLRLASYGPELRACLAERDDIAAAAADGLGEIGETQAVPALTAMAAAAGRSAAARTAAAAALGSISDPVAVPALEALLRAGDWSLRAVAARGLAELGAPGKDALRRAAGSVAPDVREPAAAALTP